MSLTSWAIVNLILLILIHLTVEITLTGGNLRHLWEFPLGSKHRISPLKESHIKFILTRPFIKNDTLTVLNWHSHVNIYGFERIYVSSSFSPKLFMPQTQHKLENKNPRVGKNRERKKKEESIVLLHMKGPTLDSFKTPSVMNAQNIL